MKKKLLLAGILLTLCLACLFTIGLGAAEAEPTLSVDYVNLSFNDSVYIKYGVSAQNATQDNVCLLVWRKANTGSYAYGTQDETILPAYTDTIEGKQVHHL